MDKTKGTGPQIKRREVWVALPDAYEAFEILVWVNAPTRLWAQMDGGDEDEILDAVTTICRQHNGWQDFDGQEYPQPTDREFWAQIPDELMACILVATRLEAQRLPKSMVPVKRKSRAS
jgi:hypothetical protein